MQTAFEAWAPWGQCAGSCGGTGVRQRIRGCHHKMMGFLEFSEECPLDGKETQTCVVSCHQTTPRMSTAIPGKLSIFTLKQYRMLRVVHNVRGQHKYHSRTFLLRKKIKAYYTIHLYFRVSFFSGKCNKNFKNRPSKGETDNMLN